jgi:hypothetical protein
VPYTTFPFDNFVSLLFGSNLFTEKRDSFLVLRCLRMQRAIEPMAERSALEKRLADAIAVKE